jgi:hypothetical protein
MPIWSPAMKKRTRPQTTTNNPGPRKSISWKYSALTVVCGTILVSGFFFAARQHFSSMDYGIRNSRLRRQLDELESEKRRLLLNREISLSPSELMKAARRIGFSQNIQATAEPVKTEQISSVAKTKSPNVNSRVVQKTVISEPATPAKTASNAKPASTMPRAKKETKSIEKKYKS